MLRMKGLCFQSLELEGKRCRIIFIVKEGSQKHKSMFQFFISIFLSLPMDGHHFGSTIF